VVSITVIGEAVLDVVKTPSGETRELPGGSPANTALALTRLGVQTHYRGRLSNDSNGQLLFDHFKSQGVDMSAAIRVSEPSSVITAVIAADGAPTYQANLKGASDYGWQPSELSKPLPSDCLAVDFGSLATAIEPGASAIANWVAQLPEQVTRSYDPNIRPGLMNRSDEEVRLQIDYLVRQSDFVKASDVDVQWLYPNLAIADVADLWANQGPDLVVITLGENGAIAARPQRPQLEIPPKVVKVADTIGAGDTFAAAMLRRVAEDQMLGERFSEWASDDELLRRGLHEAAVAAGITCSRIGANPPTWQEVSAAL
jgi:fructokinase